MHCGCDTSDSEILSTKNSVKYLINYSYTEYMLKLFYLVPFGWIHILRLINILIIFVIIYKIFIYKD